MNELIEDCMITPGGGDILFDVEQFDQNHHANQYGGNNQNSLYHQDSQNYMDLVYDYENGSTDPGFYLKGGDTDIGVLDGGVGAAKKEEDQKYADEEETEEDKQLDQNYIMEEINLNNENFELLQP